MNTENPEFNEGQQPEELHVPTIHNLRDRLIGYIFSREVEVRLLEDPRFTIPEPETLEERMAAARELEEVRQNFKKTRIKREGEFEALWAVMNILDEAENDAIKQHD